MPQLWGKYIANYRGCLKWKETNAAVVKRGSLAQASEWGYQTTSRAENCEGRVIG
jgi:hypothetical protein